jgi:TetR/AcrR family transcriptional regulator, regulator of cefoperazone and chloramphenicol sensitivity
MRKEPPGRPTDDRLLDVAVDQFGRKGLEGASTRAIAAAAGTAMSSITYHYGGKEGLYVATARHIAAQIRSRFTAVMANDPHAADLEPEAATEQILVLAGAFLQIMLSAEAAPWARFIVREQMEPTEAFEVLWSEVMSTVSARLVALVLRAGAGRWTETEVRIRAVTLIGQILVFRVARATVLRVTGWDDIGPRRAADIRRIIHANVHAILASPGGDQS